MFSHFKVKRSPKSVCKLLDKILIKRHKFMKCHKICSCSSKNYKISWKNQIQTSILAVFHQFSLNVRRKWKIFCPHSSLFRQPILLTITINGLELLNVHMQIFIETIVKQLLAESGNFPRPN
jgi:hypothetical protein